MGQSNPIFLPNAMEAQIPITHISYSIFFPWTVSSCAHRTKPSPIVKANGDFVVQKGVFHIEGDRSMLSIFGFKGYPFLLPKFIIDRMLVANVFHQNLKWVIFFENKRK